MTKSLKSQKQDKYLTENWKNWIVVLAVLKHNMSVHGEQEGTEQRCNPDCVCPVTS